MRVCPKCGYEDNPLWQQDRFNQSLNFMRWVDFQQEYPEIAQRIKNGENNVFDGHYVYRLPKTKIYVKRKEYRQGEPFYPRYEGHATTQQGRAMAHLTKKYNKMRFKPNTQTKLFEVTK